MTDENVPDYVLVICRVCGTRMHPDLRETAYEVKCHDCYTLAPVPARADVIDKLPKTNRQKPDVGTYSLSLPPDVRESLEFSAYGSPPEPTETPLPPKSHLSEDPPPEEVTFSEYGVTDDQTLADAKSVSEPDRGSFVVRCPACDTPFAPPLIDQPQVVLCPECLEDVPVPAKNDVPQQKSSKNTASKTTTPKKQAQSSSQDEVFEAEEIPFEADELETKSMPPRRGGKKKKRKRKQPERTDDEADEPVSNPTVNRDAVGRVFDRMAEIREVGEAPSSRWTFFSGTLNFPWRADTRFRWIVLSIAMTLSLLLIAAVVMLYVTQEQGGILGVAFLAMPTFWIVMGTLAYAASGGLCILIETAHGSDTISEWPEQDWKEWAGSLVFVVFEMFVAYVMAFFIGRLVGLFFGVPQYWTGLAMMLLAPVVLLSSLEANNPLTPLTEAILRTVVFYPQGWLLFHVITGGWIFGMVVIGRVLFESPFIAATLLGPAVAAFLMIYFRLLGRVAWGASMMLPTDDEDDEDRDTRDRDTQDRDTEDDAPRRTKKRRKKKRRRPPSE